MADYINEEIGRGIDDYFAGVIDGNRSSFWTSLLSKIILSKWLTTFCWIRYLLKKATEIKSVAWLIKVCPWSFYYSKLQEISTSTIQQKVTLPIKSPRFGSFCFVHVSSQVHFAAVVMLLPLQLFGFSVSGAESLFTEPSGTQILCSYVLLNPLSSKLDKSICVP